MGAGIGGGDGDGGANGGGGGGSAAGFASNGGDQVAGAGGAGGIGAAPSFTNTGGGGGGGGGLVGGGGGGGGTVLGSEGAAAGGGGGAGSNFGPSGSSFSDAPFTVRRERLGEAHVVGSDVPVPTTAITVEKTASPSSIARTGGTFTFTVKVTNTSPDEDVHLSSLVDDVYGNLAARSGSSCGNLQLSGGSPPTAGSTPASSPAPSSVPAAPPRPTR